MKTFEFETNQSFTQKFLIFEYQFRILGNSIAGEIWFFKLSIKNKTIFRFAFFVIFIQLSLLIIDGNGPKFLVPFLPTTPYTVDPDPSFPLPVSEKNPNKYYKNFKYIYFYVEIYIEIYQRGHT